MFASCTKYDTPAGYEFSLKDGTSSGASASTLTTPECVEIKAKYDGTTETTLKWAKWNVGASKPEEYGYYFFWGGTQGYIYGTVKECTLTKKLDRNTSQIKGIKIASSKLTARNCWVKAENGEELVGGFYWDNMPYLNSDGDKFTKYIPSGKTDYWGGTGSPDNKLKLDQEDDAAYKYFKGKFRMPTLAEFNAMIYATYWAWDATDKGYYVYAPNPSTDAGKINTGTGTYNKSNALLFFPAAGDGYYSSFGNEGSDGFYWSSSLESDYPRFAYDLWFGRGGGVDPHTNYERHFGFPVRPVSD